MSFQFSDGKLLYVELTFHSTSHQEEDFLPERSLTHTHSQGTTTLQCVNNNIITYQAAGKAMVNFTEGECGKMNHNIPGTVSGSSYAIITGCSTSITSVSPSFSASLPSITRINFLSPIMCADPNGYLSSSYWADKISGQCQTLPESTVAGVTFRGSA